MMKKYDLLSEIQHRKRRQMGQQGHKYKNLLNREFHADRSNSCLLYTSGKHCHGAPYFCRLRLSKYRYDPCIPASRR